FINPRVSPNGTISVIEGSNLTLTCSDPGNSGAPRYVWINDSDGSQLTAVVNNPPLNLHLTNINRAASGNYICRSTSIDVPGLNMDTTVTLNVQSCNLTCSADLVTNGSCPAMVTSIFILNDRTINVPLTEPLCIQCRFINTQSGEFIPFSDGVWRKGSIVLNDGDFSGNVIISSASNALFLTLVHPATVVDVGNTLTCSSSSAGQQSVITIGAF
uniref:Ig-like domain-containing protein n=1 Tax=Amphimedon queenslandica TaxID=400682 RepID=A0A1X7TQW3_AMPQE